MGKLESKRIGVVYASSQMFDCLKMSERKAFYADFFPCLIDKNSHPNIVHIYGYSEVFDEVQQGDKIPRYEAYFNVLKTGDTEEVSVSFKRVND